MASPPSAPAPGMQDGGASDSTARQACPSARARLRSRRTIRRPAACNVGAALVYHEIGWSVKFPRFQLGRDKTRCLAVRFLIPPVEHRACGRVGRRRVASMGTFPMALPKATGSPPLPRFQNRACAFPFTRLLSGAAPVMSTIQPTGLGDALSTLHTSLGHAGFMSYACLLVPLPSTPPLPRQPILGMTPGLRFLGDPSS